MKTIKQLSPKPKFKKKTITLIYMEIKCYNLDRVGKIRAPTFCSASMSLDSP